MLTSFIGVLINAIYFWHCGLLIIFSFELGLSCVESSDWVLTMHINDTQNSNKYLRGTWFCMPDNTNRPKHMQSRRAGLPCLDVSVRPKLLLICTFITNERWLFVWHISNLIHLLNYRVLPVLQWSAPFHYVSVNVDLFTSGKKLQRQPYVDGFDLPSTAVSNTCKRPLWNWTDRDRCLTTELFWKF